MMRFRRPRITPADIAAAFDAGRAMQRLATEAQMRENLKCMADLIAAGQRYLAENARTAAERAKARRIYLGMVANLPPELRPTEPLSDDYNPALN